MPNPKFFALIIGSEILNRRRVDSHFDFVSKELEKYGNTLSGSFVIEDEPKLIVSTIRYLASMENSVIFSFGGIGSTPDDYTRACVAEAFERELETHKECEALIKDRMVKDKSTSKYALEMAQLPRDSELLIKEYSGGIPAFHLQKRFFFMPGFPHMSHPLIENIQKKFFSKKNSHYRYTLVSKCKESLFIPLMRDMPEGIECSCLPKYDKDEWSTALSISSYNKRLAEDSFDRYIKLLNKENIEFIRES